MALRRWLLLSLVVCAAAAATADWADCPMPCRCKWTSGKKTALCHDGMLTTLPKTLSPDLQVLDVSGNDLNNFSEDIFRNLGLVNLQKIFARRSGIQSLHKNAFRDLTILIEIDLSFNELSSLHPETFTGNNRLKLLILTGNPLKTLVKEQFPLLPHLRTLDLQTCSLTSIHQEAFIHLVSLESLNLRSNLLEQLSESIFMSTGRLNTLVLDNNPWKCDCNLRGFRNWFLKSNLQSGVALMCNEPDRLKNKSWSSVPPEEFACQPQVTLAPVSVRADQGGNVSFGCYVKGDPEPQVTWFYNGKPIGSVNTSEDLVIEVEEGLLEKWANLSVLNVSVSDVGDYSCVAQNSVGFVVKNVSLEILEVVTASTVQQPKPWLVYLVVVGGCFAAMVVVLSVGVALCCTCRPSRQRRHHMKNSVSFSDQEKKLLDVSITTTDRDVLSSSRPSCELLQGDLELMEQNPSLPSVEVCDPPVHITIESHQGQLQGQRVQPLLVEAAGMVPVVFPPPPPEFSSGVLAPTAYGNIFISVSVNQDSGGVDVTTRYPDLLDVTRGHVATLPRRRVLCPAVAPPQPPPSHYDNMGPRVTAGGSSTLSLPDAVGPPDDDAQLPPPPPPPPQHCIVNTAEYVSL